MTYTLEEYFRKAKEILSGLEYPTIDATTPLSKSLNDHSECFSIDFISYLTSIGVLFRPKGNNILLDLNVDDLKGLEFDLYKAYLEQRASKKDFPSPLRRLLQEA